MAKEIWIENLKKLRKSINKSQADIGIELGKGQRVVANWENEKSEPSIIELLKITQYFGISVDDFLKKELTDVHLSLRAAYEKWINKFSSKVHPSVHPTSEKDSLIPLANQIRIYKEQVDRGEIPSDAFIENYAKRLFNIEFKETSITLGERKRNDAPIAQELSQLRARVDLLERQNKTILELLKHEKA